MADKEILTCKVEAIAKDWVNPMLNDLFSEGDIPDLARQLIEKHGFYMLIDGVKHPIQIKIKEY